MQHDFRYGLLWLCLIATTAVIAAIFTSVVSHRRAAGMQAAHFHRKLSAELAWTLVPMLIVIGLSIPAVRIMLNQAT